MATEVIAGLPKLPFLDQAGVRSASKAHFAPQDPIVAYMPANHAAAMLYKNCAPNIGGGTLYDANAWTVTTTGTSAAAAAATTAGGGVLLTCGSTSTFYSGLQSKQLITPSSGLVLADAARVQISHATQAGFWFGFGNVQADPTNTDYTDFIGFYKAPGAATMVGKVRGNAGTSAATSTLLTLVAATEYRIGYVAYIHATSQWGYFWVETGGTVTQTAFTSSQLTQLAAILTTPPSMAFTRFGVGTTGQTPTITFTSAFGSIDS